MAGFSRNLFVFALLPALCACNLVVSEEPWFDEADAVGVPAFRDGLWLTVAEPNCQVDETLPAERWPDCAGAAYLRGSEWLTMEWEQVGKSKRARRRFVGWSAASGLVANGSPLIVQTMFEPQPEDEATSAISSDPEPDRPYVYLALQPTRRDETGRVTAFELWPVRCGPEPEGAKPGPVTDRPFPGLTIVEYNCKAESVEAVRQAAMLSEPIGEHMRSRWVREGWH
jgi:hypothetical protein